MTTKFEVLEDINIGNGVAEREKEKLEDFFLESIEWNKVRRGDADLIFGPKGSGKSTLFFSLLEHEYEFEDSNILLVSSENLAGDSVFSSIQADPLENERDFVYIWKLYFLVLIVDRCRRSGVRLDNITKIEQLLANENLYEPGNSISSFFSNVAHYIKSRLYFDQVDGEIEIDPNTGLPKKIRGKFSFSEPAKAIRDQGVVSIDQALRACNASLVKEGYKIWILIDRLDVIFANDRSSEALALRALFRVYSDFSALPSICPKIFLRDDIWRDITRKEGFREASHLVSRVDISWGKSDLVDLILRRLLTSTNFCEYYHVNNDLLATPISKKMTFINTLFPRNMTLYGEGSVRAFEWVLVSTRDGQDVNTPRDIIELLNFAKEHEIIRMKRGDYPYRAKNLIFNHEGLSKASSQLSKIKMEQTIFAEHPELREAIDHFNESPTRNFDLEKLQDLWGLNRLETINVASKLSDIGVLRMVRKGQYLIPVLYTHYLGISPQTKRRFT